MKMNNWLMLAATLSAGLLSLPLRADDQPAPTPSGTSTPGTSPTPAEKPSKKKKTVAPKTAGTASKKAVSTWEPLKAAPLVPGPAVVTQPSINVRGQPAINSEVIIRLKKGERLNVLEEVTLKKPKTDEPAKWAKVSLPTNAAVWVNASFINLADKTVVPKKLNVRSGPGENYSVVARISKGTVLKDIETKGDWMKIEPPADSYGFVAAHLLASEPASPAPPPVIVASVEPPKPLPTETVLPAPIVPAAPAEPVVPVAPQPVPAPVPVIVPAPAPAPVPAPVPPADTTVVTPPPPATPAPPVEEILVKRVVSREGIVKRTVSIQAPTYFALQSLDTGKMINYLFSPSTNVLIKDYMGKRIVVTGEEVLDERWPNTPVINVDTLQAVP